MSSGSTKSRPYARTSAAIPVKMFAKKRGSHVENLMAKALRRARVSGWRRDVETLPGIPDFAWPASRVVLFTDGCFRHRCPWHGVSVPKTNRGFWRRKFKMTKTRDRRNNAALIEAGWYVVRSWECSVKYNPQKIIDALSDAFAASEPALLRVTVSGGPFATGRQRQGNRRLLMRADRG